MASSLKKTLIDAVALEASFTSEWFYLDPNLDEICFWLSVSAQHADTTLDCKIQHSADKLTAVDLVSFTQMTGTEGAELKAITLPIMGFIRAVVTLAGATTEATTTVEMLHSTKG